MIDAWIGLPLGMRFAILAVTGILGGALANHVIYTWCYFPRAISPWAKPSADATPRKAIDRIPIVGWLSLRREASIHGKGFWVRPMLIEIALAILLPWLYQFEALDGGVLPAAGANLIKAFEPWGTQIFFGHLLLVILMVAATFIDFDEQTVPDIITVPGTIVALILAACSLQFFMPIDANGRLEPVMFFSPWALTKKWVTATGLMSALGIWSVWCFALADRRLILRKGLSKAVEFFLAGLVRHPTWKLLAGIWCVGVVCIVAVYLMGGNHWLGLLNALVGLTVGGGIVWAIRIVGFLALRKEAMGFGDVTLLAMIGAFLGWQAAACAFFIAPFTAMGIVLIQVAVTKNPAFPFGPYLCAGSVVTILFWERIYPKIEANLGFLGPQVLWFGIAMLGLMGVMLFTWQVIKDRLFGR